MSSNIFGKGDDKEKQFGEKVEVHSKAILNIIERHKNLESSIDLINEKIELLDHNSIKSFKKLINDQKNISSDIRDLKQDIVGIKEFNRKFTKQIKLMTTKDEVMKLEKYIDLWNPMNFATKDELQELRKQIKKDIEKIIEGFLTEDITAKK